MQNELQVIVPWAPLSLSPDLRSGMETQLLFGERFLVRGIQKGWCEGVAELDGTEGFVPRAALGPVLGQPTHRVKSLRTPVYTSADHRVPTDKMLSFLTPVAVLEEAGAFVKAAGLGWIAASHLEPINSRADDFATIAERFIGTPYLWGGRTSLGLDCSGLLQLSLQACGYRPPRNADPQRNLVGTPLEGGLEAKAQRGDILFIPGHTGIFVDSENVVHAHSGNGRHLTTFVQSLHDLLTSFSQTDREASAIHRLGPISLE